MCAEAKGIKIYVQRKRGLFRWYKIGFVKHNLAYCAFQVRLKKKKGEYSHGPRLLRLSTAGKEGNSCRVCGYRSVSVLHDNAFGIALAAWFDAESYSGSFGEGLVHAAISHG